MLGGWPCSNFPAPPVGFKGLQLVRGEGWAGSKGSEVFGLEADGAYRLRALCCWLRLLCGLWLC